MKEIGKRKQERKEKWKGKWKTAIGPIPTGRPTNVPRVARHARATALTIGSAGAVTEPSFLSG
jgi:hypothetical protein